LTEGAMMSVRRSSEGIVEGRSGVLAGTRRGKKLGEKNVVSLVSSRKRANLEKGNSA